MSDLVGLSRVSAWEISIVAPVILGTALLIPAAFWADKRRKRTIASREATGVDPRAASVTIELEQARDDALDLVGGAFSQLPLRFGADVFIDRDSGLVRTRTRVTWRSFGQEVEASVVPRHGGSTVVLRSWPMQDGVITDYGQGKRLVADLVAYLSDPHKSKRTISAGVGGPPPRPAARYHAV